MNGTLQFKKDIRLIGERTIGNESRIRFSAKKTYPVKINKRKLTYAFIDVDFVNKAWVQGISRKLFTFTPNKT